MHNGEIGRLVALTHGKTQTVWLIYRQYRVARPMKLKPEKDLEEIYMRYCYLDYKAGG